MYLLILQLWICCFHNNGTVGVECQWTWSISDKKFTKNLIKRKHTHIDLKTLNVILNECVTLHSIWLKNQRWSLFEVLTEILFIFIFLHHITCTNQTDLRYRWLYCKRNDNDILFFYFQCSHYLFLIVFLNI